MQKEKEILDYCRVKKIFEKGFGFLTSLYYQEPVFFHFNKVKDEATREKLEKLKRGEVYFFYTSVMFKGKRRVYKLWLDVKSIDKILIPEFIDRIIIELNDGKTNVFELAHVIKILREEKCVSKEKFKEILNTKKLLKTPSMLKPTFSEEELIRFDDIQKVFDDLLDGTITKDEWIKMILGKLYL